MRRSRTFSPRKSAALIGWMDQWETLCSRFTALGLWGGDLNRNRKTRLICWVFTFAKAAALDEPLYMGTIKRATQNVPPQAPSH